MRTSGLLTFLLLGIGCSGEQSRSVPPPPSAADPAAAEPSPPPDSEAGPEVPVPEPELYARSPEVQRLLYRARRLRAEGQFDQALAAVEQALRHDPDDPAASALRQELLEILTRN